nr:hypothetical protein [Tanacetum cinerariifolium]
MLLVRVGLAVRIVFFRRAPYTFSMRRLSDETRLSSLVSVSGEFVHIPTSSSIPIYSDETSIYSGELYVHRFRRVAPWCIFSTTSFTGKNIAISDNVGLYLC